MEKKERLAVMEVFAVFLQLPQSQQGPAEFPAQPRISTTQPGGRLRPRETWEGEHSCCRGQEFRFIWGRGVLKENVQGKSAPAWDKESADCREHTWLSAARLPVLHCKVQTNTAEERSFEVV